MKNPADEALEKFGKMIQSITSATAAIPNFSNGDPVQITQRMLDSVATFAPLE